jgi:hypothetical protein
VGHRRLSGAIGGGLCAASFGLILASVVSHLTGFALYVILSVIFLCGAVLSLRAASSSQVEAGSAGHAIKQPRPQTPPVIEQSASKLPLPARPTGSGTSSNDAIEAKIDDPFIAGSLLRIYVRNRLGKENNGKYYAEGFGVKGRFPGSLAPGPWRVPWNDAPAGRPRYIDWRGADLRLGEWDAHMTFLVAGDRVKRRKAWGNGPWQVIVRLRREGSNAYVDTAFDIRMESGVIVFQKA